MYISNFNYCLLIWHFCREANSKKIEKKYKKGSFDLFTEIMTLVSLNNIYFITQYICIHKVTV